MGTQKRTSCEATRSSASKCSVLPVDRTNQTPGKSNYSMKLQSTMDTSTFTKPSKPKPSPTPIQESQLTNPIKNENNIERETENSTHEDFAGEFDGENRIGSVYFVHQSEIHLREGRRQPRPYGGRAPLSLPERNESWIRRWRRGKRNEPSEAD